MNVDPAAILALLSEKQLQIATLEQQLAELQEALNECSATSAQRSARPRSASPARLSHSEPST